MSDEHSPGEPRPTPYELVFGPDVFDEQRWEQIREQADAHGATTVLDLFMLPAASDLLRELIPPADEQTHADLLLQVRALLFHAFRFWLHGGRVYEFTEAAARALLARTDAVGAWALATPAPAGYVQLPRNLLWARVAEDAAPEPVDGFFWSAPTPDEGVRGQRLDLLLALGVRRGRPGLSLVDVGIEDSQALQHWADVEARPGGTDFANVLPGGELQGYHALTTHAEMLKLVSRCFWHIDSAAVVEQGSNRVVVDG